MKPLPERKPLRLKGYDYSTPGAYFITICVKHREQLLSNITSVVGDDAHIVPDARIIQNIRSIPRNVLSYYGEICDKYINNINLMHENVTVDKYVIMPNHIHLIIFLHGTMRASSPTKNIASVIRSFKTMVTKEIGIPVWQRSYHDHIIRDEKDYSKIWEYIDTNPGRWEEDCFYNQ